MKRTRTKCPIFFASCCVALSGLSWAAPQTRAQGRPAFDAFFDQVTRAEGELFRGRAEPLKALWSHSPDVTLFGVSGGRGDHGWDQVGQRLDWASTQYSEGSLTVERIAAHVDGNLGYVVQREKARFKVPGQSADTTVDIRATWIFRREQAGWRIIHRQADSQMKRAGPAEVRKASPY